MSKSSANQYDSAFQPQRLQNWCEPRHFKERGKAWPDFKGTWDLPARIPARCINPTGRSVEGLNRLKTWGFAPEHGSKHTDRLHGVGQHTMQTNGDEQQKEAALSASVAGGRDTKMNNKASELH
ncbi:protein Flattop [Cyclopterus lumpus]|uniref:protein Flattop n=1 Tax=Cyclopterus lumpus TaxID=8103 RepID=UPI00148743DB|nr:protein Flattop [Cyclopterus lumpus]